MKPIFYGPVTADRLNQHGGIIQQFSFSVSRRFLDGVMERRLG
jgi:hypothetical protein